MVLRFSNLLLTGLIAGTLFGIWIGYDPVSLSAGTYIEQQQAAIRSLNVLMPMLGLIAIILTLLVAVMQRKVPVLPILFAVAALLLIVSGMVTRLVNQPINSIVMIWNRNDPPMEWMKFRDQWWHYHKVRTIAAIGAFCLILVASLRKQ